MTADTSASAPAGADDPLRLRAADVATTLSVPMRRALQRAQEDMFADRATVTGHGMTLKALRRRAIVTRGRPSILTQFGRLVIATGRCGDEVA